MYKISDAQIDFILDDIRAQGVEMEDLQYNLLDHICCIIEKNLKEGESFEEFYQKTIKRFYKDALWEIEEETLKLLIFKNYYTMKKTMIVSGWISSIFIFVGSFFKIMHWPGASILLILGLGISALLFVPLLFTLKIKERKETRDKAVLILGLMICSLIFMSTLFKIQHWPGASILTYSSVISLFIFVPLYFFTGIRDPERKTNVMITSMLILTCTGVIWLLMYRRPSMRLNENFRTVIEMQDANIKILRDKLTQPKNDSSRAISISNDVMELFELCNKLKAKIIVVSTGIEYTEGSPLNTVPLDQVIFMNDVLDKSGLEKEYQRMLDLYLKINANAVNDGRLKFVDGCTLGTALLGIGNIQQDALTTSL